jgi:HEAT repeat protein
MFVRRWVSIILILSLSFLAYGCGRERKDNFELGKGFFLASDYQGAVVRLEEWVKKKKNPNQVEAHAMLALMYHDMEYRKADYEREIGILKEYGEPGMEAILRLMQNPTTASRLQSQIDDVLVAGGSFSIGPLMASLSGANWRLKTHAQQVLAKMGETAVPALESILNSSDRYAKSMAIEALSKINNQKSMPLIEKKLDDPDMLVKVTAAIALHSMGKDNPSQIIIDSLKDPDIDVRRMAAKAMAETFDNPPSTQLLPLLKDADPDVRNYATIALGKSKNVESVQVLVNAMRDDKNEEVRNSASKAIESIGTPAVDPLIKLLNNTEDMELIIRIAQILGNIGDDRAVDSLESKYKKEKRDMVKAEVAKALNKIPLKKSD